MVQDFRRNFPFPSELVEHFRRIPDESTKGYLYETSGRIRAGAPGVIHNEHFCLKLQHLFYSSHTQPPYIESFLRMYLFTSICFGSSSHRSTFNQFVRFHAQAAGSLPRQNDVKLLLHAHRRFQLLLADFSVNQPPIHPSPYSNNSCLVLLLLLLLLLMWLF